MLIKSFVKSIARAIALAYCLTTILTLIFHSTVGNDQCIIKRSQRGFALENASYSSSLVADYPTCLFQCINDNRCRSLSYDLKTKICDLNKETRWSKPLHYIEKLDNIYKEMIGVAEVLSTNTYLEPSSISHQEKTRGLPSGPQTISTDVASSVSHQKMTTDLPSGPKSVDTDIFASSVSHQEMTPVPRIGSETIVTNVANSVSHPETTCLNSEPQTVATDVANSVSHQETTTDLNSASRVSYQMTQVLPIGSQTVVTDVASSVSNQEMTTGPPIGPQTVATDVASSASRETTPGLPFGSQHSSSSYKTITELSITPQTTITEASSSPEETNTSSDSLSLTTESSPTPAAFDSSTYCIGKASGDYAHPSACTKYITCSHGTTYVRECNGAIYPGICGC